jgi:hypothetical protein
MLLFMITWQTHAQTQISSDTDGEAANDLVKACLSAKPMAQQ